MQRDLQAPPEVQLYVQKVRHAVDGLNSFEKVANSNMALQQQVMRLANQPAPPRAPTMAPAAFKHQVREKAEATSFQM